MAAVQPQRPLQLGNRCSWTAGTRFCRMAAEGAQAAALRMPVALPPTRHLPAAAAAFKSRAGWRAAQQPPGPIFQPWPPSLLQWDKVENKTSVIVYGAGGIVVLWLAATIVGALNNIPLVSNQCMPAGQHTCGMCTARAACMRSPSCCGSCCSECAGGGTAAVPVACPAAERPQCLPRLALQPSQDAEQQSCTCVVFPAAAAQGL